MNNIRYANLNALKRSKASSSGVAMSNPNVEVFAGMWTITLLTQEGFVGYRKIKEEKENFMRKEIKRAISRALSRTSLENENDLDSYKEEVRRTL